MKRKTRLIHKWLGLISCFFIFLVSLTAIGLNHPEGFSRLFLNKNYLEKSNKLQPQNIKILAIDPFLPSHLIASDLKGLFQSRDNGITWVELKLFVPTENVNNIQFDPFEKDKLVVSLKKAGIFVSDDGGEVWDELKLPFSPNEGEYIENISLSKNLLVVKTRFGLYFYSSGTDKWHTQVFNNMNKTTTLNLDELVYNIHTGRIFGDWGVIIYDMLSFGLILLSLSGIFLSLKPRPRRSKNENEFLTKNDKTEASDIFYK